MLQCKEKFKFAAATLNDDLDIAMRLVEANLMDIRKSEEKMSVSQEASTPSLRKEQPSLLSNFIRFIYQFLCT